MKANYTIMHPYPFSSLVHVALHAVDTTTTLIPTAGFTWRSENVISKHNLILQVHGIVILHKAPAKLLLRQNTDLCL